MTTSQLRREIKKAIDQMPKDRLQSLADYASFLTRPSLQERISQAEKEFKSGKGVAWRKVRRDV